MELSTLNTPYQVLDRLLALNLSVTLWSARTKLTPEDFGGVALPPDELASLGSKKICDPAKLAVFTKLKSRALSKGSAVSVTISSLRRLISSTAMSSPSLIG